MTRDNAAQFEGKDVTVRYTDLQRTGPRRSYETTPGCTVSGIVKVYDSALAVHDPVTGRMRVMMALGLVEAIIEPEPVK